MPSKSPAQHRLMQAAAHNPTFAKKVGVPQSVGKEFTAKDKSLGDSFEKPSKGKFPPRPPKSC